MKDKIAVTDSTGLLQVCLCDKCCGSHLRPESLVKTFGKLNIVILFKDKDGDYKELKYDNKNL